MKLKQKLRDNERKRKNGAEKKKKQKLSVFDRRKKNANAQKRRD